MKNEIFEFAKKLNIEYIGIAPVMHYADLEKRIKTRKEKYGLSEFEEENIEKRTNPRLTFPWAKSVIVCLFPYYTEEDEGANVSLYAKIPDYHKILHNKLEKVCDFIKSKTDAICEHFTDTGVLHDRYLAERAGLGFMGQNTCLINEKYGTYFFVGYIVTDLDLEPDKPLDKECLKCQKCKSACPGNAIDGEFHINAKKCVSYITQLKKINDEQKEILKGQKMVYGCEECQKACPYNQNPIKTPMAEFYEKKEPILKKEDIENLSNKGFKEKYGDFAFSWRGKATILKNFDK